MVAQWPPIVLLRAALAIALPSGLAYLKNVMARFLIIAGLILLCAGLLWPFIAKLGVGRLPGDIVLTRGNTTFYFPLVTSLLLSLVLSAVLWLMGR